MSEMKLGFVLGLLLAGTLIWLVGPDPQTTTHQTTCQNYCNWLHDSDYFIIDNVCCCDKDNPFVNGSLAEAHCIKLEKLIPSN